MPARTGPPNGSDRQVRAMRRLNPSLEFVRDVLAANSIEEVWQLHTAKMTEYGFDRMIYVNSRFCTGENYGDLADALVLTNYNKDLVNLMFQDAQSLNALINIRAARNIGACSWQWTEDERAAGRMPAKAIEVLDLYREYGIGAGYTISFAQVSELSKSAIGLSACMGFSQPAVDAMWADQGAEIELLNNVVDQKLQSLPYEGRHKPLTDRQREVLRWVAQGKTLQDIAVILGRNQATVEKHLRLARQNLNVETTAQAVLKVAIQNQFFVVKPPPADGQILFS